MIEKRKVDTKCLFYDYVWKFRLSPGKSDTTTTPQLNAL